MDILTGTAGDLLLCIFQSQGFNLSCNIEFLLFQIAAEQSSMTPKNHAGKSRQIFIPPLTLPEIIKKIRQLFRSCFNVTCIYFGCLLVIVPQKPLQRSTCHNVSFLQYP
jgi:hypothetical protein